MVMKYDHIWDVFKCDIFGISAKPIFCVVARSYARTGTKIFIEGTKAIYELAYELNNRPDWVAIPLQGVSQVLSGAV